MEKFIKENGLSAEGDNIHKKPTDYQAKGVTDGNLMSTMERTCSGIVNKLSPPPLTSTSHREYLSMILD